MDLPALCLKHTALRKLWPLLCLRFFPALHTLGLCSLDAFIRISALTTLADSPTESHAHRG